MKTVRTVCLMTIAMAVVAAAASAAERTITFESLLDEMARPRKVFDRLGFSATLAPGSMLLISSFPDRPGSLGHHFFTTENGSLQQKLVVVRLAQTQSNPLFVPPKVLRLW